MAIREIARRMGLSRNTVRKDLANGVVEPQYPKRKSIGELAEQGSPAYTQVVPLLEKLLKAKVAECEVHSSQYQIK